MRPTEAERLLGGYATGTLSEAERQTLFAAALKRQDLFDALVDEDPLRELLSDPAARAQLLAALSRTAPPKIIPFWRRSGLLSAAAGLIVAATAGLAYLRSPGQGPPPLPQEATKPAQAGAAATPPPSAPQTPKTMAGENAPATPLKETARSFPVSGAPAPPLPASAREPRAAPSIAEAQDKLAKKAEAPRLAAALMKAAGSIVPAPGSVRAKALRQDAANAGTGSDIPAWTLDPLPDGSVQVTVMAPQGTQAVLLKRSAHGIEVSRLIMVVGPKDAPSRWRGNVRLATGDVLDLYVVDHPVVDPAKLPETGVVDGFRARIHPAAKPDPAP